MDILTTWQTVRRSNRLHAACVCGVILSLGALMLGIGGCGGSSTGPAAAPSYTLGVSALNPASITAGNTSTSTVTLTAANGYAGNVRLSCGAVSGGMQAPTCSFSPATVTISGPNAETSTLTVSTSGSTPAGTYSISITASDANKVAPSNGPLALKLTTTVPPSYSLTSTILNPASIAAGNTSTSSLTITPARGYTGNVSLSCDAVSGGMQAPSCSFSPAAVSVSGINPATSTLTVSTSMGTPGGRHTITVTASDANQLAPSNGAQVLTLTTAALIQHVVIIFQENRSTDNLFHDPVLISRGADIASSGKNSLGQTVPLTPINLGTVGSNPSSYDLGHAHEAFVAMYDGGKMDGLNPSCAPAADCPPNFQYKYVKASDVQPYFTMAEQYTFADRMFQTNQGPSFIAHQFILSGTSAPSENSPLFAADNPTFATTRPVGCIAPLNSTVDLIDATGSMTSHAPIYPCFEHTTLTDLLDARGLSWRYYSPIAPGSIWTAPNAIDHICQAFTVNGVLTCTGPIWTSHVIIPQTQIFTDIANGQLAKVSWVIPSGLSSDHSNSSDGSGPAWVASVVNAIGNSAYWANTAVIITWDDWGGWYDHVAPKVINDGVSWGSGYVYGFRVPLIVVSPYTKAAYISHVTHDFGSILKFIETAFTLPSLGYADVAADDLSDCFNLTQTPITFQTIPAPLGAAFFLHDKRPATAPDDD